MFCTMLMASPALKQWITVTMNDGTQMKVMLIGDEWGHYFIAENGKYVDELDNGTFHYIDNAIVERRKAVQRKAHMRAEARRKSRSNVRKVSVQNDRAPHYMNYRGEKHGIVILAEFSDKAFYSTETESAKAYYNAMLNEEGYNVNGAPGSVHDYFCDMSTNLFSLKFDIFGPVTLSKSATYYGGTSSGDLEGLEFVGEFITESVTIADSLFDIDWTKYDWDDDGEVDQVFVLYAGYGRATNGPKGSIWPHEYTLTGVKTDFNTGGGAIILDEVKIDTYGCSNELVGRSGTKKMGLGTFCHEFSHCMGLPDTYSMSGDMDMGSWDLMSEGNYNKNYGWCPAPWTPWERHYAGWLEYTELQENDSIKELKPLLDETKAYVIYNDNNRNEYYTLHNSGKNSWDAYLESNGLLITHVDYDEEIFANNIVNTVVSNEGAVPNDHCRMLLIGRKKNQAWSNKYDYAYPLRSDALFVDSLTDSSLPAAKLYNENSDGTLFMQKPVYDISLDETTGYISFNYMPVVESTGIYNVDYDRNIDVKESVYNLHGQRLGSVQKGINIINGRKVLVK